MCGWDGFSERLGGGSVWLDWEGVSVCGWEGVGGGVERK